MVAVFDLKEAPGYIPCGCHAEYPRQSNSAGCCEDGESASSSGLMTGDGKEFRFFFWSFLSGAVEEYAKLSARTGRVLGEVSVYDLKGTEWVISVVCNLRRPFEFLCLCSKFSPVDSIVPPRPEGERLPSLISMKCGRQ